LPQKACLPVEALKNKGFSPCNGRFVLIKEKSLPQDVFFKAIVSGTLHKPGGQPDGNAQSTATERKGT
jgi:hypothetical protein